MSIKIEQAPQAEQQVDVHVDVAPLEEQHEKAVPKLGSTSMEEYVMLGDGSIEKANRAAAMLQKGWDRSGPYGGGGR